MLLPALLTVLAGAGDESRAATLPGPQTAHGSDFTLLIKPDGSLWSWGANDLGQLGNGEKVGSVVAAPVGAATDDWEAVACGEAFSLAIKSDGSLWAWGANTYGQLGLGDTSNRSAPEQVGSTGDWVAIAAGDNHALALRSDGSLWAWGRGTYGQLGLGDVAGSTTPARVGSDTDWDEVRCGRYFSAALKSDHSLWTWGRNDRGQLGLGDLNVRLAPVRVGAESDSWVAADCGDEDMRALKSGGTLWAWGFNSYGQLGLGDQAVRTLPTRVGTDANWTVVACGDDHTAALKQDGSLWTWGDNNYGQLGRGTADKAAHPLPLRVGTGSDWSRILCGDDFTTALRPGAELWGWGDNTSGDLGLGDVVSRLSPGLLFVLTDTTPPAPPSVTSSTHPDAGTWYSSAAASFSWSPPADASGIAGYKLVLDSLPTTPASTGYPNQPHWTRPTPACPTASRTSTSGRSTARATGGRPGTRQIRIDTTAPTVTPVTPTEGAAYGQGSQVTCAWTSADAGAGVATQLARLDGAPILQGAALDTVRAGDHALVITAVDGAGNQRAVTVHYTVAAAATFTVAASVEPSAGGSVTPSAPQAVSYGGSVKFTITPAQGYYIADVRVDGDSVGPVTAYTFPDVKADHTLAVTFAPGRSTGLTLGAARRVVTYGQSVELLGQLRDESDPARPVGLEGRRVEVQWAETDDGPWLPLPDPLGASTTSGLSGELGALSLKVAPEKTTYYRLRYQPDQPSTYSGAISPTRQSGRAPVPEQAGGAEDRPRRPPVLRVRLAQASLPGRPAHRHRQGVSLPRRSLRAGEEARRHHLRQRRILALPSQDEIDLSWQVPAARHLDSRGVGDGDHQPQRDHQGQMRRRAADSC